MSLPAHLDPEAADAMPRQNRSTRQAFRALADPAMRGCPCGRRRPMARSSRGAPTVYDDTPAPPDRPAVSVRDFHFGAYSGLRLAGCGINGGLRRMNDLATPEAAVPKNRSRMEGTGFGGRLFELQIGRESAS